MFIFMKRRQWKETSPPIPQIEAYNLMQKKHTTSPQLNAQKDRRPTVVKSRPATRNLSNSMSSAFTHLGENIVQQTAPPQRLAIES